jgi:hypothetical protein
MRRLERRTTVVGVLIAAGLAVTSVLATGAGRDDPGGAGPVPRTPWGEPDLQGIWSTGYIETPIERPDKYQGREFLTDEEVKEEEQRMAGQQDHSTGGAAPPRVREGDTGTYNSAWSGRGRDIIRTRRTSLLVDPPDGRIPWKPGVRERVAEDVIVSGQASTLFRHRHEDNERGGDGPEDRPNDRCLGLTLPHKYGTWENGGSHQRIVQSPGAVSMYYEYGPHGGVYRTIPTDGRSHLAPGVRQWIGHPVGRWEGDTLVVDTANFSDRTSYFGSRDNLHLVERFTRTGPDLLMYTVTVEDDTVFARPWTMEVPFTRRDEKANQIFESACHEGNYGLTGILAGARERDKVEAAKKRGTR